MLEIPLTQGKVALIDDEDLALVSAHKWRAMRARNTWYALTRVPDPSKRDGRRTVGMHRLIMDAPAGVEVDHENHNGLDNQRTNLRLAPDDGNRRNRRVNSNSTSGYKGVCWDKRDRKWRAQIQFDGKRHYGYFDDPTASLLVQTSDCQPSPLPPSSGMQSTCWRTTILLLSWRSCLESARGDQGASGTRGLHHAAREVAAATQAVVGPYRPAAKQPRLQLRSRLPEGPEN
jgi:hypothetical protein